METQLTDLDVERVDLVIVPANRRKLAVLKSAVAQSTAVADMNDIGGANMAEEIKTAVPAAEEPKAEVVAKADFELVVKENGTLKGRVEALEKAARISALEPLCKAAGVDVEKAWALECLSKDMAGYFMGKLDEANKRIEVLMKASGDAGQEPAEGADEFMAESERIAKADKVTLADAMVAVAKARPELYAKHTREARKAARV